jgi:hypothetical protein
MYRQGGVRLNSPERRSLHTVSYDESIHDAAVGLTKLDKLQIDIV